MFWVSSNFFQKYWVIRVLIMSKVSIPARENLGVQPNQPFSSPGYVTAKTYNYSGSL